MTKESFDSNRLNYLIWRYLIESDYQETAVRLQKEWDFVDPSQLPFASHVQDHALVRLLNKGLLYDSIERVTERQTTRDVVGSESESGIFGPITLARRPAPASAPATAVDEDDIENTRKRLQEQSLNQNASVKRPRLSNGYENEVDAPPKSPMDVDEEQNDDGNAYPSPEQLPSPTIATNGPEKGTQMEKVSELITETTFLDLSDDPASSRNTVLLQCEFNPRDPTVLAAAGTDALARMWSLSRTQADSDSDTHMHHVSPPYQNLLNEKAASSTIATGLAWSSDGHSIAIASEPLEGESARVEVWNTDGTSTACFESFESPVINLKWNFSNTLLLAISPEDQGTIFTIMSPNNQEILQHSLPGHNLMDQPLDVEWTSNDEFVLCGGDTMVAFSCADGVIAYLRKYETHEGQVLSKITFDWPSKLLATATDLGVIHIWDQEGRTLQSFNAHQGVITSLLWQPTQVPTATNGGGERLLVSAGEDGAISIWDARSSETKSRSSMTMGSGVAALAFTPDGAFIAGATAERILIWKVGDVHVPRASWARGSQSGWQTPQSHDSAPEEDQHSLCWDANGQKLAYGVNGLLAIINFRR